jgi:uncharacterized protein (TIGR02300 family)
LREAGFDSGPTGWQGSAPFSDDTPFQDLPVANPELGAKQVCPNCQAKFYDLNRRPAHCPKCDTEFDPEEALKLRNRRGRPAETPESDEDTEDQVADKKKTDGDDEEEEDTTSTPEIDQEGHEPILTPDDDDDDSKSDSDDAGMGEAGDDDDVSDDDDDSVPFLEDDDDDSFEDEIVKPGDDED